MLIVMMAIAIGVATETTYGAFAIARAATAVCCAHHRRAAASRAARCGIDGARAARGVLRRSIRSRRRVACRRGGAHRASAPPLHPPPENPSLRSPPPLPPPRPLLEKVGNLSRTVLAVGIAENELRRTAASIVRLDEPVTEGERAVAAAC